MNLLQLQNLIHVYNREETLKISIKQTSLQLPANKINFHALQIPLT